MATTPKILIADDDLDILEQVGLIFKAEGWEVFTAAGRAEAEELLLSIKPDLAVFDLMMEEMDAGFVLCSRLKRLYPDVPVILMTAVKAAAGLSFSGGSAERQAWIKADLVLDKPVRPEVLKNEVRRLLNISAPAPQPH